MNMTECPILVGVTGHRDLADPQKIGEQLTVFFERLADALPHSRFCLVSGLATGADQIFVNCGKRVLAERAKIFAVLPFSRGEFQRDFTEQELPEFQRLLASADYIEELPGDRADEAEAYFAVGKFLVEHVNILVSVWDGKIACAPNGEPLHGGTWEVSDLWMNYEQYHPQELFSTSRISALIHIPAERVGGHARTDKPYRSKDIAGEETGNRMVFDASIGAKKFLSRYFADRKADYALEQIDAYNAVCRKNSPGREISKTYLGVKNPRGVRKEIERFAVLDDAANVTQKSYGQQFSVIFMLSFLLGVCAQIYGGISHDFLSFDLGSAHLRPITWTLPIYFFLVVGVFVYWLLQKSRGIDNKYLDNRVLAELLRIAIFWKIAGIKDNVRDLFLRKNPEHLEWTVIALDNWNILDRHAKDREECVNDTDIRHAWVEDQLKYYEKNADRLRAKASRIHKWAVVFAVISMIFGVYFSIETFVCHLTPQWIHDGLYVFNGILVCSGSFFMASLNFFLEKKGWDETAESYRAKAKLFGVIFARLEAVPPEKVPFYLSYLGRAAIQEHEEWLIQQRQRKPEPNI